MQILDQITIFGWKSEDKTKKVWKFILQGGKANEVPSQPITEPTETTGIPPRTEKQIGVAGYS